MGVAAASAAAAAAPPSAKAAAVAHYAALKAEADSLRSKTTGACVFLFAMAGAYQCALLPLGTTHYLSLACFYPFAFSSAAATHGGSHLGVLPSGIILSCSHDGGGATIRPKRRGGDSTFIEIIRVTCVKCPRKTSGGGGYPFRAVPGPYLSKARDLQALLVDAGDIFNHLSPDETPLCLLFPMGDVSGSSSAGGSGGGGGGLPEFAGGSASARSSRGAAASAAAAAATLSPSPNTTASGTGVPPPHALAPPSAGRNRMAGAINHHYLHHQPGGDGGVSGRSAGSVGLGFLLHAPSTVSLQGLAAVAASVGGPTPRELRAAASAAPPVATDAAPAPARVTLKLRVADRGSGGGTGVAEPPPPGTATATNAPAQARVTLKLRVAPAAGASE